MDAAVNSDEVAANGLSDYPSLNADGTVVAFQSMADNLDADTPLPSSGGPNKVYLRDLDAGTTEMVSVDANGDAQAGQLHQARRLRRRHRIAFASESDLSGAPGPAAEEEETVTVVQVWVRDTTAGTSTLASTDSAGVAGNASAAAVYGPTISSDGTVVGFESLASNLVAGDTNEHHRCLPARHGQRPHHPGERADPVRRVRRLPRRRRRIGCSTPARPDDPIAAGETITIDIAGVGEVPADAVGVALNVTVTEPSSWGWLTIWPADEPMPTVSTLNFVAGETVANAATLKIGDERHGVDQQPVRHHPRRGRRGRLVRRRCPVAAAASWRWPRPGRSTPGSTATPVAPTRSSTCPSPGPLGVPTDATAVALSVTAVDPTSWGWLTVWPTGATQPPGLEPQLPGRPDGGQQRRGRTRHRRSGQHLPQRLGTTQVIVDLKGWFDATCPTAASPR